MWPVMCDEFPLAVLFWCIYSHTHKQDVVCTRAWGHCWQLMIKCTSQYLNTWNCSVLPYPCTNTVVSFPNWKCAVSHEIWSNSVGITWETLPFQYVVTWLLAMCNMQLELEAVKPLVYCMSAQTGYCMVPGVLCTTWAGIHGEVPQPPISPPLKPGLQYVMCFHGDFSRVSW